MKKKKLRVLHLVLGVGETSMPYNEFALATRERHEVALCTFSPVTFSIPPEIRLHPGDGTIRGFFRALDSAFGVERYEIVHCHAPHVGVLYYLYRKLLRQCPPAVLTVHNSFGNFRLRNKLLLILTLRTCDRIVYCSEAARESFPQWLRGPRDRVIPNGADFERIQRVRKPALYGDKDGELFLIGCVGRLAAIKNPLTVLEAFRRIDHDNSHLLFIGDGELRFPLEAARERSAKREQIELAGLVARDRVFELVAKCDLLVSASYGEGLPVAVLEAMACGTPVVLSDIPPHREIVGGADWIPLVPPNDVAGFAREIERFGRLAANARRRLGEQCRELVERRFSLRAMHNAYDNVFQELLESRRCA